MSFEPKHNISFALKKGENTDEIKLAQDWLKLNNEYTELIN